MEKKTVIRNYLQHDSVSSHQRPRHMLDQAGKPGAGLSRSAVECWNSDAYYVRPRKLHAGFQHGDGGQRVQLAQLRIFFETDELL